MSRLALLSALLLSLPARAASPSASSEEVDALASLSGARAVEADGKPSREASALLDDAPDTQYEPLVESLHPLVLQLAEPFDLTRLEVINSRDEEDSPGLSVKRLRVEHGPSHKGPWALVAELELEKGTQPRSLPVSVKKARYLRVTLLENHGNGQWYGLSRMRAWGRRSVARKIDFTGAWVTNLGQMRLRQVGQRVTGCYAGGTEGKVGLNTVEGTVEGSVFFGTWREAQEDATGYTGTMAFALTQEGDLSGVWGDDASGAERDARWDGTRLPKATLTCEKPEADLDEELARKGRVVLRGILFDPGKDTLRPESQPVLEALAAALEASAEETYRIESHTDDRGGEAFSQTLSERRAARVKAWLVDKGLPAERLQPRGLGMSQPTLPNDSEAGRAANRRVEVVRVPSTE
jgi:outer membrane protein OmpA-like peptidoglycan-associated protein